MECKSIIDIDSATFLSSTYVMYLLLRCLITSPNVTDTASAIVSFLNRKEGREIQEILCFLCALARPQKLTAL